MQSKEARLGPVRKVLSTKYSEKPLTWSDEQIDDYISEITKREENRINQSSNRIALIRNPYGASYEDIEGGYDECYISGLTFLVLPKTEKSEVVRQIKQMSQQHEQLANWLKAYRGGIPESWHDTREVSDTVYYARKLPTIMVDAAIAHPDHSIVLSTGFRHKLDATQLAVVLGRGLSALTIEEILEGQSVLAKQRKPVDIFTRVKTANRLVKTHREAILTAYGLPVIPVQLNEI